MDLTDYELQELGLKAKTLIDLHLNNPEQFGKEKVLDQLIDEYERIVTQWIAKLGQP